MAEYRISGNGVSRLNGAQWIPNDPANTDWRVYLQWLAAGNTPDPALPPPTPERLDFGTDEPPAQLLQLTTQVDGLKAYLGVATPTLAQTAAALKALIRVVWFIFRRAGF